MRKMSLGKRTGKRIAAVLIAGLLSMSVWACNEKKPEKNEPTPTGEVTHTATPTHTVTPTPTATPAPTEEPTPEPTEEPTPEPTPEPELAEPGEIKYGDLTQYLGLTAGEIIGKIGRDYQFRHWGKEYDMSFGTSGGFTFDANVIFYFEDSSEKYDPSYVVTIIEINDEETDPHNIGNGMNSCMKWKEIKAKAGNALADPILSIENDMFVTQGIINGCKYRMLWEEDPLTEDSRPDSIMFSKTGMRFIK
ncbi:MAG: hypothetical protein J5643_05855 [Lachnospiraceae bacterium]|nr:hypothetical protein [Lachnospiraceae bacterium]